MSGRAPIRPAAAPPLAVALALVVGLGPACAGEAMEAARRDLALAAAARDLAMSERPNRQEELSFGLNLKRAESAFEQGDYDEAGTVARLARQAAEDVHLGRIRKRDEAAARLAWIRRQIEEIRVDDDPRLDIARCLREVSARQQVAAQAFAGRDYDTALAAAGEALLVIERRYSLFLIPTPSGSPLPGAEAKAEGTPVAGEGTPGGAPQGDRDLVKDGKPGVWEKMKAFIKGEPGSPLAPEPAP